MSAEAVGVAATRLLKHREYNARPEVKAQQKEYRERPERRAAQYEARWGVPRERALPWMSMMPVRRRCWMCGEGTHGGADTWVLDHDHKTLEIRGWAHFFCNIMEGKIRSWPKTEKFRRHLRGMLEETR